MSPQGLETSIRPGGGNSGRRLSTQYRTHASVRFPPAESPMPRPRIERDGGLREGWRLLTGNGNILGKKSHAKKVTVASDRVQDGSRKWVHWFVVRTESIVSCKYS